MDQNHPVIVADVNEAEKQERRGYAWIAWIAIIGLVLFSILAQQVPHANEPGDVQQGIEVQVFEMQAKTVVGASQIPSVDRDELVEKLGPFEKTPPAIQFRFIIVRGELSGASDADELLDKIADDPSRRDSLTNAQRRVLSVLQELYTCYDNENWEATSVGAEDRAFLKKELGWFGALASAPNRHPGSETPDSEANTSSQGDSAAPADPARKEVLAIALNTFFAATFASLFAIGIFGLGCVGAALFGVFAYNGQIHSAVVPVRERSAIYAETFAVWMASFTLLSFAAALVVKYFPQTQLLASSAGSALSLIALLWPVLRGISWKHICNDIGIRTGKGPAREILWGFACYVANIPTILLGFLVMLVLMVLYGAIVSGVGGEPIEPPAHPIVEWIREADIWARLHIFVLACVIAPITEETMFRGVLYQHLRGSTSRWRTGTSVLFSTLLNSLIFAIIHPQGLLAAPALMAVAIGPSLAREWRGSLLAPMTIHGVNNGALMILLFALV